MKQSNKEHFVLIIFTDSLIGTKQHFIFCSFVFFPFLLSSFWLQSSQILWTPSSPLHYGRCSRCSPWQLDSEYPHRSLWIWHWQTSSWKNAFFCSLLHFEILTFWYLKATKCMSFENVYARNLDRFQPDVSLCLLWKWKVNRIFLTIFSGFRSYNRHLNKLWKKTFISEKLSLFLSMHVKMLF